jgi:hypothetical protein
MLLSDNLSSAFSKMLELGRLFVSAEGLKSCVKRGRKVCVDETTRELIIAVVVERAATGVCPSSLMPVSEGWGYSKHAGAVPTVIIVRRSCNIADAVRIHFHERR